MQRDLKEYIVKLNDRNLQRQRETGITMYALIAAFVIAIFYILDNFPEISKVFNESNFLLITSITGNTIFIIFLLYAYVISSIRSIKLTKIYPNFNNSDFDFSDILDTVTLLLISYLNFRLLSHTDGWQYSYHLIFFILLLLNGLSPIFIFLYKKINRLYKERKGETVEKVDYTLFNKEHTNVLKKSIIIYFILLSSFSIYTLGQLSVVIDVSKAVLQIKYIIIVYALVILVKRIYKLKIDKDHFEEIEEFEKDIFFHSYSNDEIIEKFEAEHYGVPVTKWLNNKFQEIQELFEIKRQEFQALEMTLIDLEKIDKAKLQYEYQGRLNDVIRQRDELVAETKIEVNKLNNHFKNLRRFASLNNEEASQLRETQVFLNNSIHHFNTGYKLLNNRISNS